jgi:hypothetical protein
MRKGCGLGEWPSILNDSLTFEKGSLLKKDHF